MSKSYSIDLGLPVMSESRGGNLYSIDLGLPVMSESRGGNFPSMEAIPENGPFIGLPGVILGPFMPPF